MQNYKNESTLVKIYGKYKGSARYINNVEKLSEIELFFLIHHLNYYIWRCHREVYLKQMVNHDFIEDIYALEYLKYQTTRFGVKLKEPSIFNKIGSSESYESWYQFYENHFYHLLTDKDLDNLKKDFYSGKDITKYLPETTWQEQYKNKTKVIHISDYRSYK